MLLARGLNNENRFNDKNEMKENIEVKLIKDTVPLSKQMHNMIRYNVAGGRWVWGRGWDDVQIQIDLATQMK